MTLEDLLDAHLTGGEPTVPSELRNDFDRAVAAHAALAEALDETLPATTTKSMNRTPPTLSADYEILREVGHGGMGVVYLARQKSLGRNVAVKVLRPGEATFGPIVKRFLEEAKHLARLRHPNIVTIHEIGQAGGEPYFTMDFVEGEPLSTVLARERLSPSRALAILKQAAAAVQHAHEHGTIHRDLKPSNILLDTSGHAYVTDFGLARDLTRDSNLTRPGEVMGTPAYMAPEQALGKSELVGEATDIHALGVILYEMLTGKLPYGQEAPAIVISRLIFDEPTPPRKVDRRIPRELETICLKAMAKAPERRYGSVKALLEDIRRFEAGEPILARRPGPMYHVLRWARRHWKVAAAVLVTASILTAIAPRLYDKSSRVLINWGDEQRQTGEYAGALKTYARAFKNTNGAERRNILQAMLQCGRELNDPVAFGGAVQEILSVEPDVSFEEFDFEVAKAWIKSQQKRDPGRLSADEKRKLLEIGEKRLLMVTGSMHCRDAEKQDAGQELIAVRGAQVTFKTAPELVLSLPKGDPSNLLLKAADEKGYEWTRGTAALAAGFELEQRGDRAAALDAYRQAYDLMRAAFPCYAGKTGVITVGRVIGDDREMKECRMLRQVAGAIQRLDSAAPDKLRGGLRLKIVGVKIPAEHTPYLSVTLYDPKLKESRMWPTGNGMVPTQLDQTAWLGVADGTYRVKISLGGHYGSGSLGPKGSQELPAGFEIDVSGLPEEVTIAGKTVELTIPARALAVVALQSPANGTQVNLKDDDFRWSPLPGAAYYKIAFSRRGQGGGFYGAPAVKTTECVYRLTTTPQVISGGKHLPQIAVGETMSWSVDAYDDQDRHIGATSGPHTFKVSQPLDQ